MSDQTNQTKQKKERKPRQPQTPPANEGMSVNLAGFSAKRGISLDLGNGYCNLQADGGVAADWRAVQARVSDSRQLDKPPFDHLIKIDGQQYVFGEAAYIYAPRTIEDYPATNRYTSAWYRRMFAYALHRAYGLRLSESPFYPEVVLSIPAEYFANDAVVEAVKRNLIGAYTIETVLGTTLQVVIHAEKLVIIPEGAGSFLAAATIEGDQSPLNSGLWIVGDGGYLTFDCIGFLNGDYVPDLSRSDPAGGVSRIASAVNKFIAGETGVSLPTHAIDAQLACDEITVNRRTVNIAGAKRRAIEQLGERVGRFIMEVASGQNLAGVLLTGGAAELLRDAIQAPGLPPLSIAPNPRRANVEGGFKLIVG
jgi:hypothetical protein